MNNLVTAALVLGGIGAAATILVILIRRELAKEVKRRMELLPRHERVLASSLKLGPVRHASLSEEQIRRITQFKTILDDVDPTSLEETIKNFCRDMNPDREIEIWENITKHFGKFVRSGARTTEQKKEAFMALLVRSGCSDEQMLAQLQLKYLTRNEIEMLIADFGEAKPVEVVEWRNS